MTKLLSYTDKGTWIHRLSGSTKLIFFLLWCVTSAMTYDTRILLIMIAVTVILFALSKTEWRQISAVFKIVMFFMILNVVAIFIISPYQGCSIYGSKTILTPFLPGHAVTREELFYLFNVVIKYFTVTPAIFIFLVTTDPSEFAASMNTIGIPYTVAYSVAIALRYIPDVQGDYRRIRNAQQARGEKINIVSNAMELRGFGKKKKRSWYAYRKFQAADYIVLIISGAFCVWALWFTFRDGSRFWNPWG